MNRTCYDCQYKARSHEIGPDKKEFDSWMRGNTMVLAKCDDCGEEKGLLPEGDMDRAIRASQGKSIHPAEWD